MSSTSSSGEPPRFPASAENRLAAAKLSLCLGGSRGLAALLEQEQPRLFADQAAYLERFPADAGFDLSHGDLVRPQIILCACAVSSNGLEFESLRCLFCACSVQWRRRQLTKAVWCSVPVQHRRRGAAAPPPPNPSRAGVRPGGASGRDRVASGPACCAGRRGGRGWSARAYQPPLRSTPRCLTATCALGDGSGTAARPLVRCS